MATSCPQIINWLRLNKRFTVSSDLHALLLGVWHDRLSEGALILTYLATKNESIIRFPTHPDRSLDGLNHSGGQSEEFDKARNYLINKTPSQLLLLEQEVKTLSINTRNALIQAFQSNKILLKRAVAPILPHQNLPSIRTCDKVEEFVRFVEAAHLANINPVSFDMDIVSGWSQSAANRYGAIELKREWDVKDIFLVSDLINGPMESDEWLCLNREPSGLVSFFLADIDNSQIPSYIKNALLNNSNIKKAAADLQVAMQNSASSRNISIRPSTGWRHNPIEVKKPSPWKWFRKQNF